MTQRDFPSDKLDQYMLRFPDGMRDELKAAAKKHGRSLNQEIIARLEKFEEAEALLADFQLLKDRVLAAQQRETEQRENLTKFGNMAAHALETNQLLVGLLISKLGTDEEEIKKIMGRNK